MNTPCESTSSLEQQEQFLLRLLLSADVGSQRTDQQQGLLLDSAPCSHSLDLCLTKPRSLRDARFSVAKERRSLLTNLNPFSEVELVLTGVSSQIL